MITSLGSASWLYWLVFIAFAACFGGILVFCGLWKEKKADDSLKREHLCNFTAETKSLKSKSEIGWWTLMVGVFVEIVTAAALAVRGELEIRALRSNDPLNKPVSDVSATATINLRGVDGPFWQRPDDVWIELLEKPVDDKSPGTVFLGGFQTLLGENVRSYTHRGAGNNYFGYVIRFDAHLLFEPPQNGFLIADHSPMTPKQIMDKIHLVLLSVKFIPKDAEIVGGFVEILVNGSFSKQFQIYGHQETDKSLSTWNPGFGGVFLYATNAAHSSN